MKFESKVVTLKNKVTVVIREAVKADASDLLETGAIYLAESPYLITSINEFNFTKQQEAAWIRAINESENSLLLIAEYNGKVIGNVNIKGETRSKIFHNALLGIAIIKKWQGIGLGTTLMNCGISWARKNPHLKTLWLTVHTTNSTAITLYKKVGFEIAGIQKNYIREKDSSFTDSVLMGMDVSLL